MDLGHKSVACMLGLSCPNKYEAGELERTAGELQYASDFQ